MRHTRLCEIIYQMYFLTSFFGRFILAIYVSVMAYACFEMHLFIRFGGLIATCLWVKNVYELTRPWEQIRLDQAYRKVMRIKMQFLVPLDRVKKAKLGIVEEKDRDLLL